MAVRVFGFLAGISAFALAASPAARAQSVIEVDQEPGFDTGTDVTQAEGTFTIRGGEVSGANLFHSFARFDLASGDIAQWVRTAADAAAIEHVINRVRSDTPSRIDGTIRLADMPNADFWFVNPAGVIFGAGARLDVPGAAHFSTAQEIGLGSGERFSTVTPDGSTFSSAAPQAFGFLGGSAQILIEAGFGLPDGAQAPERLVLTGADIALEGNHGFAITEVELVALGEGALGDIALDAGLPAEGVQGETTNEAATGAIRIGSPSGEPASIELSSGQSFSALAAEISLVNTDIIASSGSQTGGVLAFLADTLTLENSAIVSLSDSAARGADILIATGSLAMAGGALVSEASGEGAGGDIVLGLGESVSLGGGAQIVAETSGPGQGGSIAVQAPLARIDSGASIAARGAEGASGAGGTIALAGGSLLLDAASIVSNSQPAAGGEGGTIDIRLAGDFTMTNGSIITASTINERAAGDIVIEAENLSLSDAQIFTDTMGEGDAGIVITTARGDFLAEGNSLLASSTFGPGRAGGVLIEGTRVLVAGEATIESQSLGQSSGEAGVIVIAGGELVRIEGSASITASTQGDQAAGTILIDTRAFDFTGGEITSVTQGAGDAGEIFIEAQDAVVGGDARIASEAAELSSGMAGGIDIAVAGELAILDLAALSASTLGSGAAGDITIVADTLVVDGGDIRSASESEFAEASAGAVELEAQAFEMRSGVISSLTSGPAAAGTVEIRADAFSMTGGQIDSSSSSSALQSAGAGGAVEITARTMALGGGARIGSSTNAAAGGAVFIDVADQLEISDGFLIEASTSGRGTAGLVGIVAPRLIMSGGNITSFTAADGDAGGVLIEVGELIMSGGRIDTASDSPLPGAGRAGLIAIMADSASLSGNALIDSTGIEGDAGDVGLVVAGSLSLADEASISAQTSGAGEAGLVTISAGQLRMTGGIITSQSLGPGNAGVVTVDVGELAMSGGEIGSAAAGAGDAGDVVVEAVNAALSDGALIDSETFDGSIGNAGTVSLSADETLTIASGAEISTTVRGGELAGDIAVAAPTIRIEGNSAIASEAAGTANAGSITLIADRLTLADASAITTDSENGPAGAIGLFFPEDGVLRLDGLEPSVITTSSGANTGGVIAIANPSLILSTGGSILALGEQGGANVQIVSEFFIRSSDRLNEVSVDGSLVLDSQVGEQIAATPPVDLGFLDASGILSGQCAPLRAGGRTSQFTSRITGPYAPSAMASPGPTGEEPPDPLAPSVSALAGLAVCP